MSSSESIKRKRLTVEIAEIHANPIQDISTTPRSDADFLIWDAVILGPDQTVWQNAVLLLEISFKDTEYPFDPPKVRFQTSMYHPNIYKNGDICLNTLKKDREGWSPSYSIRSLLIQIQSLLCDPNPDDPANPEAAQTYVCDRHMYEMKVRERVKQSLEDALPIELRSENVK
ncbi:Ubiquitin-conjugating enzyme E2 [Spironucleus salmonicida]|uniref:Ubiquitin-conjugating enzyme E2 n=1 Tax=Spironucleus salmonicida TaxID=348837 RepID=V6LCK3_9EUKA|nr:Ubiquitin-conjugating enzyme E2 [Spironucleus salmonicida]|eukprot:EST41406.1 Ubiquitin-conjugating enzyme E2 [Spironucleus salmonicida]